jgi:pyruvate/2-oxoglutarate dehydrogenase complex dihydrolipoamide dehydrogenase (E3) component
LTHVAGYEALVAVTTALFRVGPKLDLRAIPTVTFCDPEVARAGLTERGARQELGREPLIFGNDHRHLDRALTARAEGFSKLVTDRRGKLLGATLVGPAAGDALAETARLVREGRGLSDLSGLPHAYPTFAESPVRAAEKWWAHRYLTPTTRRVMRPLFALARLLDSPS